MLFKTIFTFVILGTFSLMLPAQTLEMERNAIEQRRKANDIGDESAAIKKSEIRQLFLNAPLLKVPFDTITRNYLFQFEWQLDSLSDKAIFQKVLEWCALKSVRANSGMRLCDSVGHKIVLVHYCDLRFSASNPNIFSARFILRDGVECWYSLLLQVNDGKISGIFSNVEYVITTNYSNLEYFATSQKTQKIGLFFPLSSFSSSEMKSYFNMINATAEEFNRISQELKYYLD